MKSHAESLPRYDTKPNSLRLPNKRVARALFAVAIAATVAGLNGCGAHAEKAQSHIPTKAATERLLSDPDIELDPTIEQIIVDQNAKLRADAYVPDKYDNDNVYEKTDESFTITVDKDVLVKQDKLNRDWFGIPQNHFDESAPKSTAKHVANDNDHYIWVNSQRATAAHNDGINK